MFAGLSQRHAKEGILQYPGRDHFVTSLSLGSDSFNLFASYSLKDYKLNF